MPRRGLNVCGCVALRCVLCLLYVNQSGTVNWSLIFPIQRRVKQADTLSALFFNCIVDIAFDVWRASLQDEGLFIAHRLARLTNTQYANDELLYAKSLEELMTVYKDLDKLSENGKACKNAGKRLPVDAYDFIYEHPNK